jgi:hypothetical protein
MIFGSHSDCFRSGAIRPECLDLLPVLEQDTEPARLYFSTDLHWTVHGHRVAAPREDFRSEEVIGETESETANTAVC